MSSNRHQSAAIDVSGITGAERTLFVETISGGVYLEIRKPRDRIAEVLTIYESAARELIDALAEGLGMPSYTSLESTVEGLEQRLAEHQDDR